MHTLGHLLGIPFFTVTTFETGIPEADENEGSMFPHRFRLLIPSPDGLTQD